MNIPSDRQLLDVCIEAARTAGGYALSHLCRREEVAQSFVHDVKLVMDSECQRIAEKIIHRYFPDHAILGEEGLIARDHPVEWVIDPIDGTSNYMRGLPSWCCSIAARHHREALAGCVFVPVLNECYAATVDGPALCNGHRIRASEISTLGKASFFTGLTKDVDPRSLAFFCDMAPRVSKIRMIGSAAIDLCHVACGRSDGYFEAGLYLWDIAAGRLIAERAGAVCTVWPRQEEYSVRLLCANPHLYPAARERVEKHFLADP